MDCQYTSREQWSSLWTASTPVESSGVLYGLPVHQQRVVKIYFDCQYTSGEQQSSLWTASTPVESSIGLPFHQQRVWSSIWTASTPLESSGVHQQRVLEFYMDCQYTSREQWRGVLYGLPVHQQRLLQQRVPVHQQRVLEFYMDCQYTSREQWSSIRTASTPVESSKIYYGLPVHQQRVVGVLCQGLPVHQQRVVEFL